MIIVDQWDGCIKLGVRRSDISFTHSFQNRPRHASERLAQPRPAIRLSNSSSRSSLIHCDASARKLPPNLLSRARNEIQTGNHSRNTV
jgi:hypothetical protein